MKPNKSAGRVYARSIEALDAVFTHADEFFKAHDVDPQTSFAVKLAIEEIFTNFVKYNPQGRDGILVDMQRKGGKVVVRLVDSDSGEFDVTEYDEVDTSSQLDKRMAGGLGIFLVKKMVDEVQYHHSDRTSTIVLTKKMG